MTTVPIAHAERRPRRLELSPQVTVAQVGLDGSAGARQVMASLGLGLALAAVGAGPAAGCGDGPAGHAGGG
jgi:hypothetical protein